MSRLNAGSTFFNSNVYTAHSTHKQNVSSDQEQPIPRNNQEQPIPRNNQEQPIPRNNQEQPIPRNNQEQPKNNKPQLRNKQLRNDKPPGLPRNIPVQPDQAPVLPIRNISMKPNQAPVLHFNNNIPHKKVIISKAQNHTMRDIPEDAEYTDIQETPVVNHEVLPMIQVTRSTIKRNCTSKTLCWSAVAVAYSCVHLIRFLVIYNISGTNKVYKIGVTMSILLNIIFAMLFAARRFVVTRSRAYKLIIFLMTMTFIFQGWAETFIFGTVQGVHEVGTDHEFYIFGCGISILCIIVNTVIMVLGFVQIIFCRRSILGTFSQPILSRV